MLELKEYRKQANFCLNRRPLRKLLEAALNLRSLRDLFQKVTKQQKRFRALTLAEQQI